MTTSNSKEVLYIADYISQNLAFRDSADSLFNYVNSLEKSTIIDFSGIKNITNSFAHQYMANRKKTEKIITEINISPDVKQMFELIEKRKSKPSEITTEPIEVLELI
jgi:thiamine kinase-like enzyme